MNDLVWHVRRLSRRLGTTGLVGLALLAIACLLAVAETMPARARIDALRVELGELRARAAARDAQPAAVAAPDPLAVLPPTGEAARQIGEIERLARAHGISLPRGQYRASVQTGTRLLRWQLTLPVESTYPDLVAWLAAAFERLPNLTLDEFKLKRERIESTTLDAELRLSLFVEATP